MADALPGLGNVAAVLGVVITMGALGGPPGEIGHKVAAALVGTFLGILLCYGLFGPIVQRMGKSAEEERAFLNVVRATLIAFLKGIAPVLAVEIGRQFRCTCGLRSGSEDACRAVKSRRGRRGNCRIRWVIAMPTPVIIKENHTCSPSRGVWKVAYTDFVNAMLVIYRSLAAATNKPVAGFAGYFKSL
jgi:hypothetical protein